MDLVVTVCDNAAAEACPVWPGHPATVHWGLPDPAAVREGDEKIRVAFESTYRELRQRIEQFMALPIEDLNSATIAQKARRIEAS